MIFNKDFDNGADFWKGFERYFQFYHQKDLIKL